MTKSNDQREIEATQEPVRVPCTLIYRKPLDERVSYERRVEVKLPSGLTAQEFASMLGVEVNHIRFNDVGDRFLPGSKDLDFTINEDGYTPTIESFLRKNRYSAPSKTHLHCQEGRIVASELFLKNLLLKIESPDNAQRHCLIRNPPCRIDVGETVKTYSILVRYSENLFEMPDAITVLDGERKPKLDIILNPAIIIKSSPFKRGDVEMHLAYLSEFEKDTKTT